MYNANSSVKASRLLYLSGFLILSAAHLGAVQGAFQGAVQGAIQGAGESGNPIGAIATRDGSGDDGASSDGAGGTADNFSWPQWDGPSLSGISKETEWSSEGRKENLFELQVGLGYSTVTVANGRLYTMGYDRDAGIDIVWCLDALTGEELWAHTYESEIWNLAHEGGTVNTPVIDGDVVYSLNREGNLYCLDAETGEVRWHNDLYSDGNPNELKKSRWGFSASPLILGEHLFLNCGRLLRVDKKTGQVQWHSKFYGDGYGTLKSLDVMGKPAVAALNGDGVAVVSRENGEELYFYPFTGQRRGVNAATPVAVDDALFVSSGMVPAGALLAFDGDEVHPVWENREMANSFSGCVLVGDYLYGYDQSILKCISLDGQAQWQERGIGNGAVSAAGNRILAMGSDGDLIVLEATPEEYRELSRVNLFEAGNYWTKPILVNGIVYCRSSKGRLVARDHRL